MIDAKNRKELETSLNFGYAGMIRSMFSRQFQNCCVVGTAGATTRDEEVNDDDVRT